MTSRVPVQNQLLKALPSKAFKSVRTECELVQLKAGDVLSEPGERLRHVYFPTQSIVSLVAKATGGAALEVALVGDEGMVGLPLLLGADTKPLRILVQTSGTAWRMKTDTFKRLTNTSRALRQALNKYAFLRLAQVEQNAICANAHQIEARFARRLLMMQDRLKLDQFHATKESFASMLGVRRSSMNVMAVTFQKKHLIQYNRGTLNILDRKGLERISCQCYGATAGRRRQSKG